jgi:hypothetical protein
MHDEIDSRSKCKVANSRQQNANATVACSAGRLIARCKFVDVTGRSTAVK